MFAKIVIFCAALAASHASFVGPLGLGAPVLAAGPLGYGKGLISALELPPYPAREPPSTMLLLQAELQSLLLLPMPAPIVGGPFGCRPCCCHCLHPEKRN
ncbi:hypothetical protein HNY73_009206 [Argiope bruennichi]|uniref:Secreted protein n=1 Tax=Argiope bruennichi TaxID=94029 RepID=A0A8T0FBI6_ARGBR|nr:hypothetical protein HNY73_009206 [Argiope bruennichi]